MFYRPEDGHGLPRNPFYAVVSPRPIGWIGTRGAKGDNLAPFSFFNAISADPPMVMFAGGGKHSMINARATGVFSASIVEEAALERMNATSAALPLGEDEFTLCAISKAECESIDCPRVADAPASLECRVIREIDLPGDVQMVIGMVTGVHLRDDCIVEGRFDLTRFTPVARLGYLDYGFIRELRALKRPK